jgi:hypothetical protein
MAFGPKKLIGILHGLMWIMLLMPKEAGLMKIVAKKSHPLIYDIFINIYNIKKKKVGGRNFWCSPSHPLNPKTQ